AVRRARDLQPAAATGAGVARGRRSGHAGAGGTARLMAAGRARLAWLVVTGVIVIGAALVVGIVPRLQRQAALRAAARSAETSAPIVTVTLPERAAATVDLVLPGSIQAIQETNVYARIDGYVKKRYVDIGSRVEPGDVLAEIDTPELDQQLAQTR